MKMAGLVRHRRERSQGNVPVTLDWADRFFNDLIPSRFFRELMPSVMREEWELMPSFDISETDNGFVVKADLPGIDPKTLDITLSGNTLSVSGEKKEQNEQKGERFHTIERRFGSFSRSFMLPGDVKEQGIEATYKDGVLQLTIPKAEPAKQKKIEVKTH